MIRDDAIPGTDVHSSGVPILLDFRARFQAQRFLELMEPDIEALESCRLRMGFLGAGQHFQRSRKVGPELSMQRMDSSIQEISRL